jgi:hypothetical protein
MDNLHPLSLLNRIFADEGWHWHQARSWQDSICSQDCLKLAMFRLGNVISSGVAISG